MNKANRLRVAAAVVPEIRSKAPGRRFKVVDSAGVVTREIDGRDVLAAVTRRAGIEIAVQPGKRPTQIICACGSVRKLRPYGTIPTQCAACYQKASNKTQHLARDPEKERARMAKWRAANRKKIVDKNRRLRERASGGRPLRQYVSQATRAAPGAELTLEDLERDVILAESAHHLAYARRTGPGDNKAEIDRTRRWVRRAKKKLADKVTAEVSK